MPPTQPPLLSPKRFISQPLSLSSNYLSNHSRGKRDYRERIRIQFNQAWNPASTQADDAMMEWYRLQPHRRFQTLQYCKEADGVQHEYILVLLQDEDGRPVNSYCRLERVADPARPMEAIGANGTDAFDFIQTFDREPPKPSGDDGNSELVAQITFPRPFDPLDIISICYGVHAHPRATHYTLQQFNCYFFSWTIILCLARRSADWETLTPDHIKIIMEKVLGYANGLRSSGEFTLWSLMFGVHDSESESRPEIIEKLLTEIAGESFLLWTRQMLRALLWHDQKMNNESQGNLRSRLDTVAEGTTCPSTSSGGLLPSSRSGIHGFSQTLFNLYGGAFQSEIVRIIKVAYNLELSGPKHSSLIKEHLNYLDAYAQQGRSVSVLRNPEAIAAHLAGFVGAIILQTTAISRFMLFSRHLYDHEKSLTIQKGKRMLFQKPVAISKTMLHAPKTLYKSCRIANQDAQEIYYNILSSYVEDSGFRLNGRGRPRNLSYDRDLVFDVQVLNQSINVYSARHSECGVNELRHIVIQGLEFLSKYDNDGALTMTNLWKTAFAQNMGDEVIRAILDSAIGSTAWHSQFEWVRGPRCHSIDPKFEGQLLSHTELQTFLRERIGLLSRKEVEGASYIRHIPFTLPPRQSQEEMEEAIAGIWRVAGPLMTRVQQRGDAATNEGSEK